MAALARCLRAAGALASAAVLAASVTACNQDVDLSAVRALGATVRAEEPAFASIADDLYQSCLREQSWRLIGPAPATPAAGVCDPYVLPVKRWKAVSAVLTGYFEQLGAAAGDDAKIDYGFAGLAGTLGKDANLTAAQQTALSAAATDIADAIVDARRRKLTATEAARAGASVDYLVGQLSDVAAEYLLQLDNEQGDIDSFFSRNLAGQTTGLPALESLQYRLTWKNAVDDVNVKRTAEAAYVSSLRKLAASNDAIVKAAAANDFGAVFAAATATVGALTPDAVALQKAFK